MVETKKHAKEEARGKLIKQSKDLLMQIDRALEKNKIGAEQLEKFESQYKKIDSAMKDLKDFKHEVDIHEKLVGGRLEELKHQLDIRVDAPRAFFKSQPAGSKTSPASKKEEDKENEPVRPTGPSKE